MVRLSLLLVIVSLWSSLCIFVWGVSALPSWGIIGSTLSEAQFYTSLILDVIAVESRGLNLPLFPIELTPLDDNGATLAGDLELGLVFLVYREFGGIRLSDLDLSWKLKEYKEKGIEIMAVILHYQAKELLAGFTAPTGTHVIQFQVRDVEGRMHVVEDRLATESREKLRGVLRRHLGHLQPATPLAVTPTMSPPVTPPLPANKCACLCSSDFRPWLAGLILWIGTIVWVHRNFFVITERLKLAHVQHQTFSSASAGTSPQQPSAPLVCAPPSTSEPPQARLGLVKRPLVKQSSWNWLCGVREPFGVDT